MTSTSSLPWVDPGAFEVAAGVHRIPLPLPNDGLRAVNVYVLTTPTGLVCVDAGWAIPSSRELLQKSLASLGAGLGDITRFLVTHVHRDHYTQAVDVRRETGARVGLGLGDKPTLDKLQDPSRSPLMSHVHQLRELGAGDLADTIAAWVEGQRPDPLLWESPDEWLTAGPIPLDGRTLEAVETPGHTAGHLVFYDVAGGLLFAGDHVLPTITPSIGFEPVLSQNPLGAFLQSLAGRPGATGRDAAAGARSGRALGACPRRRAARPPRPPAGGDRAGRAAVALRTRTRSRTCCAGPAASTGSPTSTRSTRCSRSSRPAPTWTCWWSSAGSPPGCRTACAATPERRARARAAG